MLERFHHERDAAREPNVGAPARNFAGFIRAVLVAVASDAEADLRRVFRSPFSRMARADSAALLVIAGPHRSVAETIARERVPLSHEASVAARAVLRALDDVRVAYRAQGATAYELIASVALAFALRDGARERETATLDRLLTATRESDAQRVAGVAVEIGELLATIDAVATAKPSTGVKARDERRSDAPPRPPRREREAARNVRRRKTHFSASSLGAYADCARKWYYRYVCAAVEDKGSSASFYGSAFHWALERFHQEITRADAAPLETLATTLDTWIATAFERYRSGFTTNVEYQLQVRRARRTGRRYIAWFVERFRTRPFEVIGTESSAQLEIEGHAFVGYIDRLDRDLATGAVTVIDYKTGSIAESAAEYREGVANLVDFQLPFYYWARTAEGDRVARLTLVPLKDATRDVRPIELEVVPVAPPPERFSDAPAGTIGIVELERARTRMGELARELADSPIEDFAVTTDPDACTFCAYRNACRERPQALEDRFGR
jgi:ATP-dependent helicase/nuclease subunit B